MYDKEDTYVGLCCSQLFRSRNPIFMTATAIPKAMSSIWLKSCNKSARLTWKFPTSVVTNWSLAVVLAKSYCMRACVCVHGLSSGALWPTGALLSDWQLAGEFYDGAVSSALSRSPGSGSPDTFRNASQWNFPISFLNWFLSGKIPATGSLLSFFFTMPKIVKKKQSEVFSRKTQNCSSSKGK